jgi:hypothetical protein
MQFKIFALSLLPIAVFSQSVKICGGSNCGGTCVTEYVVCGTCYDSPSSGGVSASVQDFEGTGAIHYFKGRGCTSDEAPVSDRACRNIYPGEGFQSYRFQGGC